MIEAMPIVSASTGLHETLALLTSQLHPDANHKEDLVFLRDVFSEKSISYLMKIHEKLRQYEKYSPTPVLHSASCLAEDLAEELQSGALQEDERELLLLLSTPHLKAVLSAHDIVAQKKFDPVLPPLPEDLDDDFEEESVKIVRLVKNKEPLEQQNKLFNGVCEDKDSCLDRAGIRFSLEPRPGIIRDQVSGITKSHQLAWIAAVRRPNITFQNIFILGATIRRDEVTGAVIVARIMRGGAADRSGLVHVGDELREVNGNLITHKRPEEISQILSQSQGSITLKIIPAVAEEDKLRESRAYLRALFDYTPFEDKATPCQEAGLPFRRGDILQVVSQEDATWWQAKKVGDCNLRAALIPSTQFQERRLRYRLKMGSLPSPVPSKASTSSLRRSFRLRKDHQGSPAEANTPDANQKDFLIYEEVTQYLPRPGERPRLIALIGSLGSRITELKQKVIAENPRQYGLAVPHTTRARKSHEREGVEYHFISRAAFEADIQNGKFIEFGEYKENLYGTSLESIHKVLNQNKVCLVDVQPEAMKTLRTAEFKPFIIFVRPRICDGQRKHFGSSSSLSVGVTDDDLQEMRQSAEKMDECYGHWVDYVLVKEDPVSALEELQNVLERVQTEPQWVPVCWVRR